MSPPGVVSYLTELTVCIVCRNRLHLVGVISGVGAWLVFPASDWSNLLAGDG